MLARVLGYMKGESERRGDAALIFILSDTTRGCSSYFYIKLSEQNVLSIYSHNKTVEIGKNLILSEYKKLHAADCLLNMFSELCHLES